MEKTDEKYPYFGTPTFYARTKRIEKTLGRVPMVRITRHLKLDNVGDSFLREFSVRKIRYTDYMVEIATGGELSSLLSFSDVQFLTPVSYEGRSIGIGDEIIGHSGRRCIVYDYSLYGDSWGLLAEDAETPDYPTRIMLREDITAHIIPAEISPYELEKAITLLERAGKIKDGRLII